MKIKSVGTGVGFLYFYTHFVTEVVCFAVLGRYALFSSPDIWMLFLTYDLLAFVPQGIFGYLSDRFPRVPFGPAGFILLSLAVPLQAAVPFPYVSLAVLCVGNAFTHVDGAEVTLRCAGGALSPGAIFVAGGSFGVVSGQLLAKTAFPWWGLSALSVTAIPFTILGGMFRKDADGESDVPCRKFDYASRRAKTASGAVLVILAVVFVIITRGYMGYGIPTSWKKTAWQTVLLFSFMGLGKAAGGVLADLFGVRRVGVVSAAAALPFLLLGDNNITLSLIGVMFFSMTMSVTLATLVSVMPKRPGLAFGLTTIGLFMGSAPVFFFRFTSFAANCVMLSVLTAVCVALMFISIRKDGRADE
ncbi:MAG: hypothetical protein II736_01170 [Clostridia bacterium]|nr:hypothetical protein [Clostridia bacterium]